ncbi:ClpP family protease [Campylobacter geochelonis]|uniref:ClpP family protease n=1 Tax=Campylobacter geochelonis TaxID=1780362 RepID=UPI000770B3C6|nr:ATP-dependent Clp protease proteolytic subunit [Campylobacter geochelonis]CZE46937.1 ATP-dependent Clp protease proteolytic subunit [Campylobacter geochelonis]CZE50918.1 ATP-dependent Clp protease proteolytic subunit [Campylobacter geochelonis]
MENEKFNYQVELIKDRNIFLTGEINENMVAQYQQILLYLNGLDKNEEINLYISSPGGSLYHGLGLIDVMSSISAPINTFCLGICASMGAMIFINGDKRFMLEHSRLMVHQPLGGARGQASDIELVAKEIMQMKKELNSMIAKKSRLKLQQIEKLTDRDTYIDSKTAIKYGLADEILTNQKLIKGAENV